MMNQVPLHPNVLAGASKRLPDKDWRSLLRKLTLLAVICGLFFVASLAQAQQGDAMFGFGTLLAPGAAACSFNGFCPEKGGLYPNIGADVILHRRIGFGFDVSWKATQGVYGGTIPFRPILLDFNGIYQPKLSKRVGLDLFGGVGLQATRFYSGNYTCDFVSCTDFTSTHSFLIDAGGGIRYYVWGHVFLRPEVRYYWINNNTNQFSGNNVLRVGASIGYTIGPD
jgi:hypothetical protein